MTCCESNPSQWGQSWSTTLTPLSRAKQSGAATSGKRLSHLVCVSAPFHGRLPQSLIVDLRDMRRDELQTLCSGGGGGGGSEQVGVQGSGRRSRKCHSLTKCQKVKQLSVSLGSESEGFECAAAVTRKRTGHYNQLNLKASGLCSAITLNMMQTRPVSLKSNETFASISVFLFSQVKGFEVMKCIVQRERQKQQFHNGAWSSSVVVAV